MALFYTYTCKQFLSTFISGEYLLGIAIFLFVPFTAYSASNQLLFVVPVLSSSHAVPPLVGSGGQVPATVHPNIVHGLYCPDFLDGNTVNSCFDGINSQTGKNVSLAGLFFDAEEGNPQYNLKTQLEALWQKGITPFVNLTIGTVNEQRTAYDLARGVLDSGLNNVALAYKSWVDQGGGRMAFIAPLPEMNETKGNTYGGDPVNFKLAFEHVITKFQSKGIPDGAVRWVFAPNGYDETGEAKFEEYYPGNTLVDVVGFSAYNWGYCIGQWDKWQNVEDLMFPYVLRMQVLTPAKPIFITQTASTSHSAQGDQDYPLKNAWLERTYSKLASLKNVRAILYFNKDKECDWSYTPPPVFDGLKQGLSSYKYIAPADMQSSF